MLFYYIIFYLFILFIIFYQYIIARRERESAKAIDQVREKKKELRSGKVHKKGILSYQQKTRQKF